MKRGRLWEFQIPEREKEERDILNRKEYRMRN